MSLRFAAVVLSGILALCGPALATSLQVSPVLIDVPAPGAAATVTIANLSEDAVVAQARVFKWVQENGADKLVETKDVVVSPPIVKLKPNSKSVLRVVRRAKTAPQGEESYRLVIDQVPEKRRRPGTGITFAVRYSIPVFFGGLENENAPLIWEVASKGGRTIVSATNAGSRRVRLADLKIKTGSGSHDHRQGARRLRATAFDDDMDGRPRVEGQQTGRDGRDYRTDRAWTASSHWNHPSGAMKLLS